MFLYQKKWNFFWFYSGLWLFPLVLWLPQTSWNVLYMVGLVGLWLSHRFATVWIFWVNCFFEPVRQQSGLKVFKVSLLLFFFPLIWLFLPSSLLSLSPLQRLMILAVPDVLFSFYHYAAQHYGMLRLYQKSYSSDVKWFCWGIVGVLPMLVELLHGVSLLQESWSDWRLPYFSKTVVDFGLTTALFCIVGATLFVVWQRRGESSSFHTYLLSVSLISASSVFLTPEKFLILWTLQHWFVSVGLKSAMMRFDRKQVDFTLSRALFWVAFWALLTLPLFPLMEIDGFPQSQRISENWFVLLENLLQSQSWILFFSGIGIATGWLHYWHDRCVFKQSDPMTQKSLNLLIFKVSS